MRVNDTDTICAPFEENSVISGCQPLAGIIISTVITNTEAKSHNKSNMIRLTVLLLNVFEPQ